MRSPNPDTSTLYVGQRPRSAALPKSHAPANRSATPGVAVLRPSASLSVSLLLALFPFGAAARAQTAWYEGFEGPRTSWRDAGGDARYQIQDHRRVRGEAHTGEGCEKVTLVGLGGTRAYIAHDVGRPRVIDDLLPTVWVRSDRPGVQFAARVVLPRNTDPRTGRALTTFVTGSSYNQVGRWQQLRIDGVSRLLARQVPALRSELGPQIEPGGAYLDRVLLNVYGGQGATTVWIDDLDIGGYVEASHAPGVTPLAKGSAPRPGWAPQGDGGAPGPRVRLVGSTLQVDGRPFFPRIIQHRGEPFSVLEQLGFNAVWLAGPPTAEQLAEASSLGLWLVAPPPGVAGSAAEEDRDWGAFVAAGGAPEGDSPIFAERKLGQSPAERKLGQSPAARGQSPAEIGPQYAPVLAWDLGRDLGEDRLDATRLRAEAIRRADRHADRPLVCRPQDDLRGYSRHADLLLVGRRPLGSSLELADYAEWLRRQPRLATPGTPVWTVVQTEPAPELRQQLAALDPAASPPRWVLGEQIRLLAMMSVAAGSRGLVFESQGRLDAADPQTRYRAMTLELLNLELGLVAGWAASGDVILSTETNVPEVAATALRAGRSHLLLPIWLGRGAQFVPGQAAGNGVSLVVPGVPEDSSAYRIVPGRLRPLRPDRVAGGKQVTLSEFGLSDLVLMGHDPLLVTRLSRSAAAAGPRASTLARHLAARNLEFVEDVVRRVGSAAPPQTGDLLRAAREHLQRCDGSLAMRDDAGAYDHARRAMRSLRLVQRGTWERAVASANSPMQSPATVAFSTLPWQRPLGARIAASRPGPNRLAAGGFEGLDAMLAAGWRHYRHQSEGVETSAAVVPEAVHSGRSGLRMVALPEDPDRPPEMIEVPPIWITTPGVPLEAGQIVRIQAFVNIPRPITGSVDGLLIFDSFSGEALAERIGQTRGWQPLVLYRAAPASGVMRVTFALTGLGEVELDDVSIQVIEPAAPRVTGLPRPFAR